MAGFKQNFHFMTWPWTFPKEGQLIVKPRHFLQWFPHRLKFIDGMTCVYVPQGYTQYD